MLTLACVVAAAAVCTSYMMPEEYNPNHGFPRSSVRRHMQGSRRRLQTPEVTAGDIDAAIAASEGKVMQSVDALFICVMAALVFFMQLGFIQLESGFIELNWVPFIAIKNVADAVIGMLVWAFVGFTISAGETRGGFMGDTTYFCMKNLSDIDLMGFIFSGCFCITAITIDSGCIIERLGGLPYYSSAVFQGIFMYPVVSHWIWHGDGLFQDRETPVRDFAGGTAVHMVGGTAGIVGAWYLGWRHRAMDSKTQTLVGTPVTNIMAVTSGTFLLWFGWIGFNCGSQLSLVDQGEATMSLVLCNTIMCPSVAVFLAICLYREHQLDDILNCALCGLVVITPACAYVDPWAGIVMGFLTFIIYHASCKFVVWGQWDDPIGVIPVHLMGGLWGTILTGVFDRDIGLVTHGKADLLATQVLCVLAVLVYTGVVSFIGYLMLDIMHGYMIKTFGSKRHRINASGQQETWIAAGLRLEPQDELLRMWNMESVTDAFCETMFEDMARDFERYMVVWATFSRVCRDGGVGNELDFLIAFYCAKFPEFKPEGMKKSVLHVLTHTYVSQDANKFFDAPGIREKDGKTVLNKNNVRRIIRHCKTKVFIFMKEIVMNETEVMKKFFALKKQDLRQTSSFLVRFQLSKKKDEGKVTEMAQQSGIRFKLTDTLEVEWNAPLKCF